MLVNFSKPNTGILNIPLKQKPQKGVSAERMAHTTPKFVSLVPGVNDISDTVWNKIKESERVVAYRAKGWISLPYAEKIPSQKEGVPDKELTVKEYRALKSDEQIKLIEDTEQIALLKKWVGTTKEAAKIGLMDKIDRLEHPEKYSEEG